MRDGQFPVEAPVAFSIWREEQRSLVMSGYFIGKCWYISQLQGIRGANIPRDLEWTRRFVTACQQLAHTSYCNEVRLARASYLLDHVEIPEEAKERIRRKLLVHYDHTAEQLGFTDDGRWYVWRPNDPLLTVSRGIKVLGAEVLAYLVRGI